METAILGVKDAKAQTEDLDSSIPVIVEVISVINIAATKSSSQLETTIREIKNERKRRDAIAIITEQINKLSGQINEILDSHEL